MDFITSTHETESVLLRLEALVSEHQPRPSTLAELRELVSDEKPTLKDALDTMASWGKKYYGMTPARLLKSRGILASGAARGAKSEKRKPTETELSLDDGEIKRILNDVRE